MHHRDQVRKLQMKAISAKAQVKQGIEKPRGKGRVGRNAYRIAVAVLSAVSAEDKPFCLRSTVGDNLVWAGAGTFIAAVFDYFQVEPIISFNMTRKQMIGRAV